MYNILLEKVRKKLEQTDYHMAKDYLDYYAIEPDEVHRYIDEFVSVCYKYNEHTGEHEQRMPDELPFAEQIELPNGFVEYKYGCCSVIKYEKK